ncbi:MAG: hypothetical protein B6I31_00860 [Desulfobacteraceae bacterium 4572_19]|nr:MAG: hypothetical protein B6I31_00860 [Desulfobacteraceae bacterium 4572_19]
MNVLIGITGSISAYKACDVIQGLKATGNIVKVVMTPSSLKFCPIEAVAILSKNVVMVTAPENDGIVHHVVLSDWCDKFVIVPASYNTIGKIINGIADNLLTEICAVIQKPKYIFPAMNTNMLEKCHLEKLEGWHVSETAYGILACGAKGQGKLLKPRAIVEIINGVKASQIKKN